MGHRNRMRIHSEVALLIRIVAAPQRTAQSFFLQVAFILKLNIDLIGTFNQQLLMSRSMPKYLLRGIARAGLWR